ncbi:MAG TPA: class I SAM-dependent methyltransferase [Aquificales bacterium]|nr:class I SAM-dependent methyltransferase [Aquificales bacterium]
MAKIEPFERFTNHYENWFEKNKPLYLSELRLLKFLLNGISVKRGLEIGVGSGRFAAPLGIPYGVDPSPKMLKIAKRRGIKAVRGIAESLPIGSETVDFSLMVTTICFVDDPIAALVEAERILLPGGHFLIAFVDKNSPLGRIYEAKRNRSKFYGEATFFGTEELISAVEQNTSLRLIKAGQTIFGTDVREYPPKEGYGKGSFVGLLFKKAKV